MRMLMVRVRAALAVAAMVCSYATLVSRRRCLYFSTSYTHCPHIVYSTPMQGRRAAASELDAGLARPEGAWASNWQARVSTFGGRIQEAHEEFRRGIATT